MDPVTNNLIQGVGIHQLKVFVDERGALLHLMRNDSPLFKHFGEVYFSEINPGVVKAWKRHSRMTQYLAVPVGTVKFVLYDARVDSPTSGTLNIWTLGRPAEYKLLVVPPGICYGFQGVDSRPSLIANCSDIPHDPTELQALDQYTAKVPYQW